MKCSILVATIACVLSATLASSNHKIERAHSEVMSYVAENMGGVKMMRSNRVHMECYNGFLPLINSLAQRAKTESNVCVQDAETQKNNALSGLNRHEVEEEVKRITESLASCTAKTGLEYFVCLESNAEANRQLMENIKNMAKQVVSNNAELVAGIEATEQSCIINAIDSAKNDSDSAFDKLKSCIKGEATFEDDEGQNN